MLLSLLKSLVGSPPAKALDAQQCVAALEAGELGTAIECFRGYLKQHPEDALAHNNLGVALQRSGLGGEALACYETATRHAPGYAVAWYNAGVIHHLQGNLERAGDLYRQALLADPALAEAHREYSMLRLVQGDFSPEAWSSFRHRRRCPDFPASPSRCPAPLWNGEPVEDKSVLVHGEQGLGDEILFASCYPDLIARARRCVIETEPRLESLFRGSFPAATVLGRHREAELARLHAEIDFQVPCGDLPLHFRASAGLFPRRSGGYLGANAGAVARWRQTLASLGPGFKIGISWRGGTSRTNQGARSIGLEQWLPVLDLAGVHFVNLQYGDCESDLARARALGVTLHHWPDALARYDETAALVSALDLVVTVTTSIAHLAGALGQRVWILANAAPRWCYLMSGAAMPWYPSARVVRQASLGNWEDPIRQVAADLARGLR